MESFGGINSLATVVAMTGISAAKTVVDTANNASSLQQFADNQVLRGMVQQRGANNLVTIQTEQGIIKIQTEILLKRGAEVALKIESRQGDMLARLISVDGLSLAKYVEQMQGAQAQADTDAIANEANFLRPALSGASTAAQPAAQDGLASLLRGVFLSSPQPESARLAQMPQPLQAALMQAQTGTSLQVRIISIMVPSAEGQGFMPLPQANLLSEAPMPSPTLNAQPATSYLTAAQRLTADVSVQAALQNQQAAKAVLPEQVLPLPATPAENASATATQGQGRALTPATPNLQGLSPNHTYQAVANQPAATPTLTPAQTPTSTPIATTAAPVPQQATAQQAATTAQTPVPPQPVMMTAAAAANPSGTLMPVAGTPAPSPVPMTETQALTFQANVMQSSNPRELLLHQPELGSFKLFVTAPLPKGSVVTFELIQAAQVRGQEMLPDNRLPEQPRFEAMRQIADIESLEHVPHPASTPFNLPPVHLVPRTGVNMTTELLFLFAALQGGDMRRWLGEENITRLQATGKGELLSQLAQEFGSMKAPPAVDQRDGQWQQVTIPLYAEEKVQPVQYFFKRSRHAIEGGQHKDTDHFMVDVELTRMGRMQLDGLVQQQPRSYQFDMMVRSEQAWGATIEQAIRGIFQRAQEISGFQGSIQFRSGNDALLPLPIDNEGKDASNMRYIMV